MPQVWDYIQEQSSQDPLFYQLYRALQMSPGSEGRIIIEGFKALVKQRDDYKEMVITQSLKGTTV